MFAQTILNFLSQHQLFFVELEEDLEVHKMLPVFLALDIRGMPGDGQARVSLFIRFTLKDRLRCLMPLTILNHKLDLLGVDGTLTVTFSLLLPLELLGHHVIDKAESNRLLLALVFDCQVN